MTPDDVVARARELVGQEVLLTVRGTVCHGLNAQRVIVHRSEGGYAHSVTDDRGLACRDLVDIQPAPLRIEPGQLYLDGEGRTFVGRSGGRLFLVGWVTTAEAWYGPGEQNPTPDGLRPAKAVPA